MSSERTESQENYIETIHILSHKKPVVRAVDIANELGFKKPSISIAMKSLKEQGLIEVSPEGYITLTNAGLSIATSVYEKHRLLTDMLTSIGVSAEVAEEDACRVEHVISEETFERLKAHWNKK